MSERNRRPNVRELEERLQRREIGPESEDRCGPEAPRAGLTDADPSGGVAAQVPETPPTQPQPPAPTTPERPLPNITPPTPGPDMPPSPGPETPAPGPGPDVPPLTPPGPREMPPPVARQ